jgi:hypothetical protein
VRSAFQNRTHRALVKGEYDRFSETENEFVSNVFYTNPQRPESPLLAFYILWVLRQRLNGVRDDTVETRHWLAGDLCSLFEGCGVPEELVMQTLRRLYDRRLLEALDPNVPQIGMGDKIAIKESGIAHLELLLTSTVYVEQMALVTGLNEHFVRDEIRKNQASSRLDDIREGFLRYALKIDAGRIGIPSTPAYAQISTARRQIETLANIRRGRPRKGTN